MKKIYETEYNILQKIIEEIEKNPFIRDVCQLDFHGINFIDNIIQGNIFIPQLTFCSSSENQLVFDGNNKIYTCWWGANNNNFVIGKFSEKDCFIDDKKMNTWRNHSVKTISKCRNCKYKFICGGGCVFKSFSHNHSLDKGNCAEFYNIIKLYLEYLYSSDNLYEKLYKKKWEILNNYLKKEYFLIIKAVGTSMQPTIWDGDKVIIERKKQNIV